MPRSMAPAVARHFSTVPKSVEFSSAAATRSLSLSCLFTEQKVYFKRANVLFGGERTGELALM